MASAQSTLFGVCEDACKQDQAALFVGEKENERVIRLEVSSIEHADSFDLGGG